MSNRASTFALCVLLCLTVSAVGRAEEDLGKVLAFETENTGGKLTGWGGGPPGTIFADGKVVHGGQWCVRLHRTPESPSTFSTITKSMPVDFAGKEIELRGWIRTENVSGMAGLWLRTDGEAGTLGFDNMASQQLVGTHDWAQYSVAIPLDRQARRLFYGFLVSGTGTGWADDLELLVDGKPLSEAPRAVRPPTPLDTDHEFDAGSRVAPATLSEVQAGNLALLGRVWGFLKYHHPAVTGGTRHGDYDLFRVMPAVLAAGDRAAASAAMRTWIDTLGPVPPCSPCAKLDETDLHLRPSLDWLADEATLGKDLSATLRRVYLARPADGTQFYVSLAEHVNNPEFQNEPAYADVKLPDAGYQLLALFRFWNAVEYWFPYRDVIGESWEGVLRDTVPRLALAKTTEAYQLELMRLIARVNDSHANLWSALALRPPTGECRLPVDVRFVEGQAVVVGYGSKAAEGAATGLQVGDVIAALDGTPVSRLVEQWRPYYAASNEPTRLRDIALSLTRGACAEVAVTVQRAGVAGPLTVKAQRVKSHLRESSLVGLTHDRPGEAFQVLPGNVAYLKLSTVKQADAAEYVRMAAATRGWIIDIRNYPADFMVFALGQSLVARPTPFARFTHADLANPGAFRWGTTLSLTPQEPRYAGTLVLLVDEISQSSAEYTAMAFRAAPGALVIGSTTAAADGNISPLPLPGRQRTVFSGIGVFYPDKRPTQRVGIVPDVEVTPTLAGIRAGKDEVLDEALRRILAKE